jgi:hypothetical protein
LIEYAQITNNPELDGCINAVLRESANHLALWPEHLLNPAFACVVSQLFKPVVSFDFLGLPCPGAIFLLFFTRMLYTVVSVWDFRALTRMLDDRPCSFRSDPWRWLDDWLDTLLVSGWRPCYSKRKEGGSNEVLVMSDSS